MATTVLILGEVGTGKTTSLRNLDPKETFVISVLNKPLPFRGASKNYAQKDGGNYYVTDNRSTIIAIIKKINSDRKEIKNLVIDDFQYIMCNEFMRRAFEKGYDKFSQIGQSAWDIFYTMSDPSMRKDLCSFILTHADVDDDGVSRMMTIGKMAKDKGKLDGMAPVILHARVIDGQYKFTTNHDGQFVARSPMGMFPEKYIDNDLKVIREQVLSYYNDDGDIPQ